MVATRRVVLSAVGIASAALGDRHSQQKSGRRVPVVQRQAVLQRDRHTDQTRLVYLLLASRILEQNHLKVAVARNEGGLSFASWDLISSTKLLFLT